MGGGCKRRELLRGGMESEKQKKSTDADTQQTLSSTRVAAHTRMHYRALRLLLFKHLYPLFGLLPSASSRPTPGQRQRQPGPPSRFHPP